MEFLRKVCVVGMGEVGNRLAFALQRGGVEVVPVTRTTGWDAITPNTDSVVLVCVREEALADILDRLAGIAPERIVAVQNGWIRDLTAATPGLTRGLIWFTSKGDFFRELRPSPFCGPLAIALCRALARGGLSAIAASDADFDALDAEKMGFNCVVGLPLAVSGLRLGDYLVRCGREARAVFDEAVTACAAAVDRAPKPDWWSDFVDCTKTLGWVATSRAKALDFRNGAVVRLGDRYDVPTPVNRALLAAHEKQIAG